MVQPVRNPTAEERLGIRRTETITIDVRKFQALRRQLLRLVLGWRYADKEIERVLQACRHADGCPAVEDRSTPCKYDCPDRETFLSSLVIKHNAQMYAMYQTAMNFRLNADYTPPSRETFDAIVTELEILREGKDLLAEIQAELDKSATTSPWEESTEGAESAPAAEVPLTRLKPADPEPEPDGEKIDLSDSEPPSADDKKETP